MTGSDAVSAGIPAQFFLKDVIRETISGDNKIGTVLRTYHDVDSHLPGPEEEFGVSIVRGKGIKRAAFQRFLEDGVPPKDTVMVEWLLWSQGVSNPRYELIQTRHLHLHDRHYMIGSSIKRDARSAMCGIVTDVQVSCTLIKLDDPGNLDTFTVPNVPGKDLTYKRALSEDVLIIYKGWIGRVDELDREVAILLEDFSIAVIPSSLARAPPILTNIPEEPCIGQMALTKRSYLEDAQWLCGKYSRDVTPHGQVLLSKPARVKVVWLSQNPHDNVHAQPPTWLDAEVLRSDDVVLHNRCSRPEGSIDSSCEFMFGDWVCFKDYLAGAPRHSLPYLDKPQLNQSSLAGITGLDFKFNTFQVGCTQTTIAVKWQDGSVEVMPASATLPSQSENSVAEYFPGDVVCTTEGKSDAPPWAFEPAKVGVIQTVDPVNRTAVVRWWSDINVRYMKPDSSDGQANAHSGLVPGFSLGNLSTVREQVSLYDVHIAWQLNKSLGDFVINTTSNDEAMRLPDSKIEWCGEVIETRPDGQVTIRFGSSPERSIVHRTISVGECVTVWSPDHDTDWDSGSHVSNSSVGLTEDEAMQLSERFHTHVLKTSKPSGLAAGRPKEQDELGDDKDKEDDEWMTASDDESDTLETQAMDIDETANDAGHNVGDNNGQTESKLLQPATANGTDDHARSGTILYEAEFAPEPFVVLEGDAPLGHVFYQSAGPAKLATRIAKEHKILRKALPEGVFARSWETRLDLLRVLIIGPSGTPYAYAPFLFDIALGEDFPRSPPKVFFHSWTGGGGSINPNLYEDGKVCLSLLGTWGGESTESWNKESTILQVLVSILGLVLVRDPYFNEAGFENRAGSSDFKVPSTLYNERTSFRAKAFITHAVRSTVIGFDDVITWLYKSEDEHAPGLLSRALEDAQRVVKRSESGTVDMNERDGISVMSPGALVKLKQQIEILMQDLPTLATAMVVD